MEKIKSIIFDAANTIIHKPLLFSKIEKALNDNNITVEIEKLKYHHKIVSEIFNFPDRTSKIFYDDFNTELMTSLGVVPSERLLNDIYSNCSYLPWNAFDDTFVLNSITKPIGVLSNFNSSLTTILADLLPDIHFENIFISEIENNAKPSVEFYRAALDKLGLYPYEVLYIGDSIKLDMIPAEKVGINAYLIDRNKLYPNYKKRIASLHELHNII